MKKGLIPLIIRLEGSKNRLYKDPIGLYTIGVGHLVIKNDKNLIKVLGTDDISKLQRIKMKESQVAELLSLDLEIFIEDVTKRVKTVKNLEQHHLDALISLSFNIGRGAFKRSTLLMELLTDKPFSKVAQQFVRWNKAGGRVLPGLVIRRIVETHLFLGAKELIPSLTKKLKARHEEEVITLLKTYWSS